MTRPYEPSGGRLSMVLTGASHVTFDGDRAAASVEVSYVVADTVLDEREFANAIRYGQGMAPTVELVAEQTFAWAAEVLGHDAIEVFVRAQTANGISVVARRDAPDFRDHVEPAKD